MFVIYQIHDFCVNNFHYHNAVDDYHWCSHYQTLATAYEAAVVAADRNSNVDQRRTDDGCNAKSLPNRSSYSGDGNVDATVPVVDSTASSRSRLASAVRLAPGDGNQIKTRLISIHNQLTPFSHWPPLTPCMGGRQFLGLGGGTGLNALGGGGCADGGPTCAIFGGLM